MADAVPASRCVAAAVRRVVVPLSRLLGHFKDLVNAHLPVFRLVHLLPQLRVGFHAGLESVAVQFVQGGLSHHACWGTR